VADRKAVLEEEREELLGLEKDHEEEQQYMEGVIAELKEVSDDFAAEIRTAQAQAAEYAKQIRAQNAEIKRLEEEARRKAEEEGAVPAGPGRNVRYFSQDHQLCRAGKGEPVHKRAEQDG
jgi:peptidoglycan hydrolase CwlO-like protein